jgi:hypothetical protein
MWKVYVAYAFAWILIIQSVLAVLLLSAFQQIIWVFAGILIIFIANKEKKKIMEIKNNEKQ